MLCSCWHAIDSKYQRPGQCLCVIHQRNSCWAALLQCWRQCYDRNCCCTAVHMCLPGTRLVLLVLLPVLCRGTSYYMSVQLHLYMIQQFFLPYSQQIEAQVATWQTVTVASSSPVHINQSAHPQTFHLGAVVEANTLQNSTPNYQSPQQKLYIALRRWCEVIMLARFLLCSCCLVALLALASAQPCIECQVCDCLLCWLLYASSSLEGTLTRS